MCIRDRRAMTLRIGDRCLRLSPFGSDDTRQLAPCSDDTRQLAPCSNDTRQLAPLSDDTRQVAAAVLYLLHELPTLRSVKLPCKRPLACLDRPAVFRSSPVAAVLLLSRAHASEPAVSSRTEMLDACGDAGGRTCRSDRIRRRSTCCSRS
eukprot:76952-Pleurochrysis_carterae.AAC.4